MTPPRSDNINLSVQLTAAEEMAIHAERERRGPDASLSAVFEETLSAFLDTAELGRKPLPLPAPGTGALLRRAYRISRVTEAQLDEVVAKSGYRIQDIVRAAIYELERRTAGDGQGPTQTGR